MSLAQQCTFGLAFCLLYTTHVHVRGKKKRTDVVRLCERRKMDKYIYIDSALSDTIMVGEVGRLIHSVHTRGTNLSTPCYHARMR